MPDLLPKRSILPSLRYQYAPLLISRNCSKPSLNTKLLEIPVPFYEITCPTLRSVTSLK